MKVLHTRKLTFLELLKVSAGLNNPNKFDVGLVGRATGKRPAPPAEAERNSRRQPSA